MADVIPIKRHTPEPGLAEFLPSDSVGVSDGGTGAVDAITALTNLGGLSATPVLINGQPHLVYVDATRGKTLSISLNNYLYAEAALGNNDFVQIGTASDANSGYVMPFQGTIVGVTLHCENTQGNTKPLDLYVNQAVQVSS